MVFDIFIIVLAHNIDIHVFGFFYAGWSQNLDVRYSSSQGSHSWEKHNREKDQLGLGKGVQLIIELEILLNFSQFPNWF